MVVALVAVCGGVLCGLRLADPVRFHLGLLRTAHPGLGTRRRRPARRAVASALDRTTSATGELTRDEILDNITLYWLTNTGVSASRLYWEYKGGFFNAKGVSVPVAVTVFPGEQYQAPRSWAERAYPNLIYYNQVDRGGHFAAWEQPQLFTEELRAAFRSLRSQGGRHE